MKYAKKRWMRAVAVCLGIAAPAWADPGYFPANSPYVEDDGEGSVSLGKGPQEAIEISDATGSVQLGNNASASVSAAPAQQAQYITPPASLSSAPPDRVFGPVSPVFPNAMVPQDNSIGFANPSRSKEILFRVGNSAMEQYGNNSGYTTLNAFVPVFSEIDTSILWINPRINITDYGNGAANVGAGGRVYSPSQDRVWGASFWWDWDDSHARSYNQLGGSLESIGEYFSLRGNMAIPVGTTTHDYGLTYGQAGFVGSNISVPFTFFTQNAYQTYDLEATVPMPVLGRYGFDAGLGVYYLTAQNAPSTTGASVRSQAQVTENFWINGWYTYDHLFKSQFTINCEFTMPTGATRRWFRRAPVSSYLTQSVIRRYRVPVSDTQSSGSVLAEDANGNLINVAYIDPNSTSSGTGTVENPFMSVAEYMSLNAASRGDYSLIFVDPRNDASSVNLNTGISLLNNQILVGNGPTSSGSVPSITAYVNGTAQNIDLIITGTTQPLLSNSGNPGTDVITLANNNEVVGFQIDATGTANGISGTAINGFNIHDNSFTNVIDGIHITSDTTNGVSPDSYGRIVANTMTGQGFDSNNGISITQTAGNLNLYIAGNTISGFRGEDANGNGSLNVGEDNNGNGTLDAGAGILVTAQGGTISADNFSSETLPTGIIGNTLTGNGAGARLTSLNSSIFNLAFNGNNANQNLDATAAGLVVLADAGGTLNVNSATGNNFNGNSGDGASFLSNNNGNLFISSLYKNSFSTNSQNGVSFVGSNGGNLIVPAVEDMNQNGSLDVGEDLNGNGRLDSGFYGNIVNSNLNNGVNILADASNVNVQIGSATLVPPTSSDVPTNSLRNQINDNGRLETNANVTTVIGSGVYVTTLNGGNVSGGIDGNTVSANGAAGIQIAPSNGTVNLNSISNNFILNNGLVDGVALPNGVSGGDAIVYAPSNGGTFSVGQFVNNSISGNNGAIIRIGGDGGIIDLGTISGTTFDLRTSGTSGILFDAENATITGTLINNIFIGSADNANLSFGVGGEIKGGTLDLTIRDNLFDTTAGAGIGLVLGASDSRGTTGTGTGTPIEGEATQANLTIVGNEFRNILAGTNPDFSGSAISIQLEGNANTNPGNPPVPPPAGSDPNNLINPGVSLTAVISENLIGNLNSNYTTGGALTTNAGPGIQIIASGDSAIDSLVIGADATLGYLGNIIANNRSDGIQIRRSGNGIINELDINGNVIQNNLEDGVDIVATNNGLPYGVESILNFNINNNQILNNGFLTDGTQGAAGRGIQLRGEASAVMNVNIDSNIISGSRLGGIEARTSTNTNIYQDSTNVDNTIGGSDAVIYGVWQNNNITRNGFISNEDTNGNGILDAGEDTNGDGQLTVVRAGDGISLGRMDMVDPDSPGNIIEGYNNGGLTLPDGTTPLLTIQNNNISNNALDGINVFLDKSTTDSVSASESFPTNGQFTRISDIDILNNDIVRNGSNGFHLVNASASYVGSTATFNFNNNLVEANGLYSGLDYYAGRTDARDIGDGLEIVTGWRGTTTFNANNNSIINNNGRGVNALNGGAISTWGTLSTLTMNFDSNTISGNSREGFYLVNAPVHLQTNGFGSAVGAIGSGFSSTTWLADMDSNNFLFDYGRFFDGSGFAGNTPPASIAQFLDANPQNIFSTRPVTNLTFTNNIVDNNGGVVTPADNGNPYTTVGGFVIRVGTSFTSTATAQQAGVTADVRNNRMSGNYGRDVYMNGFVAVNPPNVSVLPDPLLRFDLIFENNRGGSIDVDNFDAYYTNTTPTLAGANPANVKRPNPPYTTTASQAGARAAWRGLGDNGGGLILPGFGDSMLRVRAAGSAPDAYGNRIGNNVFNIIYGDFATFLWDDLP